MEKTADVVGNSHGSVDKYSIVTSFGITGETPFDEWLAVVHHSYSEGLGVREALA